MSEDEKLTKGATLHITGEALIEALQLPRDAKLFKILPSKEATYTFDVLFFSDDGYDLYEDCIFPWVTIEKRKIIKK